MSDNLPEKYIETVSGEVVGGAVEIVREITNKGYQGRACLVKQNDRYYVVSSVMAYSGFETLIFPAYEDGNVKDWGEVGGGRGIDREQAIADFEKHGPYSFMDDDEDED